MEDDGQWRMFWPFPQHTIVETALVGNDRLLCLSEDAEICLIDWHSGKEIARRRLPLLSYRSAKIFVTADAECIVLYPTKIHLAWSTQSIVVLRATDLETIVEGDAFQWQVGQSVGRIVDRAAHPLLHGGPDQPIDLQIESGIVEDDAGRLTFVCSDFNSTGSHRGLCRFDRSDWSVHFQPIPSEAGPLRWFSASGRYSIARHYGVPFNLGGSAAEQAAYRAAMLEGSRRNSGILELWTIDPPRLEKLIVLGKTLPEWASNVVWEPDETGFWVQFGGNWAQIEYRRVGLDGSLSPIFAFQRYRDKKIAPVQKIVGLADSRQVEIRTTHDSVYIQREWCNSDVPFRKISEDEDGFRQSTTHFPPEAAVKRFLARSDRRHVVVVHELSEAAITDALRHLTRDVRDHLADLLQRDVFELSFKVAKRTMTETAFFARLIRERIPVASALRDLLTAYLAVQPRVVETKGFFRQLWGPENQGALGPAMQALLLLDPSAHDVFRDYLAKRDGEHETYSTDTIMKLYIEETGWRDRAMVRFGIYFALMAGGQLDEYGLLRAAEATIEADEFAALIVQEVDQFVVYPGLERGAKKEDLYLGLRLEMTEYGRQALAVVASLSGVA